MSFSFSSARISKVNPRRGGRVPDSVVLLRREICAVMAGVTNSGITARPGVADSPRSPAGFP